MPLDVRRHLFRHKTPPLGVQMLIGPYIRDIIKVIRVHPVSKVVYESILLAQKTRDLVPILGNKTQLEQVVVNVLSNAIDASSNDSVVKVEAGSTRDENGGEVIEVCVDDRGRGIEPDDMERIFDPFYSTKDVGDGTGLGLSISYGIITSHGGNIDVSSRPGEGTVVWIRIPVAGSTVQQDTGNYTDTLAPQNILEGTTQA